ncbi:hypothetical protein BM221_004915 [Beauveria bassiana]|uniref:Uncharacterized protein n=1 Tax=Beauveria bassiana TaxID=176275 RepID=A0A2N6NM48_BEABA|nr:hypothetical protein BM221_004915 [Beauveria bassiana]
MSSQGIAERSVVGVTAKSEMTVVRFFGILLTVLAGIKQALNASAPHPDLYLPRRNPRQSTVGTSLTMIQAQEMERRRIARTEELKSSQKKTIENAKGRKQRTSEKTALSDAVRKPVAPKASEASSASAPTPTVTTNAPGTPPPTSTTIGSSHKRTAKSQQKRIRGKNQYTKDREEVEESPARSESRDLQRTAEESHPKSPSSDTRQSSKIKPSAASKITMLDMKRRVAAIMEFISRTQVDLAAEAACQTNSSYGEASPQKVSMDNGDQAKGSGGLDHTAEGSITDKEFRNLACVEMMDVLTRDMVKWQNHYM